jgi:hypothetical protein
MEHNFERLKAHILPLSKAQTFDAARKEWDLRHVEISKEFDYCPCGQRILEHGWVHNRETGYETYVGNVCINRFMGIDTGNLFDGLKRIEKDATANANDAVIEYAKDRGYLHEGEYQFLYTTRLKRNLSNKQIEWKKKINWRILHKTIVQKRTVR